MSSIFKERLVFGEWLVQKGRVDAIVLNAALETQNSERSDTLRTSPRLLGQILLDDFSVFRSRIDLNKSLVEFEKVKTAILASKGGSGPDKEPPPLNTANSGSAADKTSKGSGKKAASRSLFGQFLIEKRKINESILEKALNVQNLESKETLRQSHRLLGEILMDDFNVFSNRVELNRLLIEFNDFKADLESQRTELMSLTRSDYSPR